MPPVVTVLTQPPPPFATANNTVSDAICATAQQSWQSTSALVADQALNRRQIPVALWNKTYRVPQLAIQLARTLQARFITL